MFARAHEIFDSAGAQKNWSFPAREQQFAEHLLGT